MTERPANLLPLEGIKVIDLSTTVSGAQATRFLSDCGADVLHVEQPGGSPVRAASGYPYLGRGKRSVVLDLHQEHDRDQLLELLEDADVMVTTWRPGVAERLGLGQASLARRNPRLVTAAITGYGPDGPWSGLKGYEALVMAKLGIFHDCRRYAGRPGPAFVSVPYASWGAAMSATQGVLAARLEREQPGLGQRVEANLVQGLASLDTWSWYLHMLGERYPGAYTPVDLFNENNEPAGHFIFPLLVAPTSDGTWLQFAQTAPHLLMAFFKSLGLEHVFTDEYWKGFPFFEDQGRRTELWELMLERVRTRTLAEWQQVFEDDPNVYAEQFRSGAAVLDHPQLVHDHRSVNALDPAYGNVRQPSTLLHMHERPLQAPEPAPALDQHGAMVRAALAAASQLTGAAPATTAAAGPPLAGVTILELAVLFAAPYGSTMLTDLGARVIKVESVQGDTIRTILEFPEAGGAKVMQGKESLALDLTTPEGLAIVHQLVKHADVVLMGYRAGASDRAGVDYATLSALNPNLIYLSAPGYGTDGPCGHRPAYAPSIGAAAGFALLNAPDAVDGTESMSFADIKISAMRLGAASASSRAQADGVAAHGVALGMLAGLVGRARGIEIGPLTTTMIGTASHLMYNYVVDYDGAPSAPRVDKGSNGLSALYQLYKSADGWIFLAAPAASEWPALVTTLKPYVSLEADPRFTDATARQEHDSELAETLADVFRTRRGFEWEADLSAADVGCAVAGDWPSETPLTSDEVGRPSGYVTDAISPMWDKHPRLAPLVRFSRSTTQALGGCNLGQHTTAILTELGYDDATIEDLRNRGVVA